jgi:hypothetical protein
MKTIAKGAVSPYSRELLKRFKVFLKGMKLNLDHPAFGKAMEFLRSLPIDATPFEINDLRQVVREAFGITDEELTSAISSGEVLELPESNAEGGSIFGEYDIVKAESDLLKIIPPRGFLNDYLTCVKETEPPLAYHVFSALVGCGLMLGGNVWIDMGVYQLFPPLAVMLLGPSGVIKTKSAEFMVRMVEETQTVQIYSEIATPQALALEMSKMSQGLIYSGELTSFLTKEKFMDGMVTFLTRVLDHQRPEIRKKTISGGDVVIFEPTPSMLTCSTLDWLIEKTPEGTFGGGFIARHILVMQDDSPRIVSRPKIDMVLRTSLMEQLSSLRDYKGKYIFTPEAEEYYDHWYRESKPKWKNPEVELMSTIYRRRTDNVQRVALILHLSHCATGEVCLNCFQRAAALLEWTDQFTIPALKKVFKTGSGKDQEVVLRVLKAMGGVVEHSSLVRKMQYKMNARQLRVVLDSLIDARQVEERRQGVQHAYFLL